MVEFDPTSKIFWVALVGAVFTLMAYLSTVFGWAVPMPDNQQIEAIVTIILGLILIFRMFFTDNPVIK